MEKYHKIVTVLRRDEKNNYKTLIEGEWATPEFEYLKDNEWEWSEKFDGTCARVQWTSDEWDQMHVRFQGKTNRAQLPTFLFSRLQDLFPLEKLAGVFDGEAILFGEGIGAKIQKGGGLYIPDGVDFILFDVMIGGHFLKREDVEDIAAKLGIGVVPIVGKGPAAGGHRVRAGQATLRDQFRPRDGGPCDAPEG